MIKNYTKKELESILLKYGMDNNTFIVKREFPNHIDYIPSYNSCWRNGVEIRKVNKIIDYKFYKTSPNKCTNCRKNLIYKKRYNKFCNRYCWIIYNARYNCGKNCLNCSKRFTSKSSNSKYCSIECSAEKRYKDTINKWLNGELKGHTGKALQIKQFVRKYLYQIRGTKCSECGWDEKHPRDNRPLTQFHHIDGDASNTTPSNLKILCPNCHSKTDSYLSRNKNSCRDRK
ncbi:hypothetical protein PBI_SCTP2_365 [Salicola phage SCTP-2]|nr:hypothetical protein PBI_SCTP2_365 [Salicola phage SCTP-2]